MHAHIFHHRMPNAKRPLPGLWWVVIPWIALLLALSARSTAQQRPNSPHIGYIYPAGGKVGTTVEVIVGGQLLGAANGARVSGSGVHAVFSAYDRPLTMREVQQIREKLDEARKKLQGDGVQVRPRAGLGDAFALARLASEAGLTNEQLKKLAEFQRLRTDPKRQLNPQIEEKVSLQITVEGDAAPGPREIRLITPLGLTNPLRFDIGTLDEFRESEPNDQAPDGCISSLPGVINGQILPGDVDRYTFAARKGQRIVAAVHARDLMPYLADAVPGWFQPVLTISDMKGHQLACADHFRFHPDPVVCCTIPADGTYDLEVRDTIYRGREDFVYRVDIGELPYLTSIFPLGGRDGSRIPISQTGWNVTKKTLTVDVASRLTSVCATSGDRRSNALPFAGDDLPEVIEMEPNNDAAHAQKLVAPVIADGRIDRPGDVDVFRIEGKAGSEIVAEVYARRLESPLDSVLQLTDAKGRTVALNDDCEDKSCGLLTHHADSRLMVRLPASGVYFLSLRDAQGNGGPDFAYRLRVSPPRPDFELRVTPSCVNARAGTNVPVTVYAIRKDGFNGDIALRLRDAPPGFALGGAWVPAGQDTIKLTLQLPGGRQDPFVLNLEGSITVGDQTIARSAQPAEDMMQAFAYHQLVPSQEWLAMVMGPARAAPSLSLADPAPVKLAAGGTAKVQVRGGGPRLQLVLVDPPEGITLQSTSQEQGGLGILFRADGSKVKPGTKGNLIVEMFAEAAANPALRVARRRFSVGMLPAIPFEIEPAR